jgi:EAL domain-containing protein (putative c-di-GMP-specific phosphodiesterase class I)
VSIGASLFPQDGQTAADIQSNADSALYSAKELGRNQFQIYSPEMRSRSAKKTQTRQMIGLALDAGMFELFYQPQVNAQGDLTGMEALVRLLHPERGVIMPDDFVPVAEEAGLIGRIDAWVMAQACRQYAIWSRAGANPPRLAVNTSRTNLMKGDLAAQVAEALRNAALHPGALQIELTESAALTGGEGSLEILRRIRQLGVSLALDDFGTGYSSLSCLHQLPVDTVKIDKSFVQAMEVGARSAPLVEAAIAAAKALGMSVAAEGVERADQMLTLTRMGCDTFQGYYISKPLGVAAATQLLMEHAQRLRADAAD